MINSTNNTLETLTDDDCNSVDGGLLITCQQFVVGMSTLGGAAIGSGIPGVGTFAGGFAGGLVGYGLAGLLCDP